MRRPVARQLLRDFQQACEVAERFANMRNTPEWEPGMEDKLTSWRDKRDRLSDDIEDALVKQVDG